MGVHVSGGDKYLLRGVPPITLPLPTPVPQPTAAPLSIDTLEAQIALLGTQLTELTQVAGGITNATYVFTQAVPEEVWTITHNLVSKFPSVTVVDSAGSEVIGDVEYVGTNQVVLTFLAAFSGKAFLN